MRAVVQRVRSASVRVDGESVGSIENGLLVFIGIGQDDVDRDVSYIADKLSALRLFDDVNGKINWSVSDVGGSLLVVADDVRRMRPLLVRKQRDNSTKT
jgi:D-tyrosyl-tRNA(Tyr) deacylase